MFLKKLIIGNDNLIIRNIDFHKGINLILDSTKSEDRKKSGNNVGKTTVLKLIDFCFGGHAKSIYLDPEFKQPNIEVENFLKKNNIIITLVLSENLDDENANEIVIRRNFLQRTNKIQEINEKNISNDKKFQAKLKELIFESKQIKPTFRQIIAKNIRDDEKRVQNTLKVLHTTTKQEEYEAFYLYLLGINLDTNEEKQKLLTQKKIEENLQARLKKENNISQIKQALLVINSSIKKFEIKKDTFSINPNFKEELENLNQVKMNLNKLSTTVSRLELRKDLILESRDELEDNIAVIDTERIKSLYEEAQNFIGNIHKTFEETLQFHNQMVQEKIRYVTQELPLLEKNILTFKSDLEENLRKEIVLTNSLKKSELNEELQQIILELTKLSEQKGNLEEQKRLWESTLGKLQSIIDDLEKIDKGIENLDDVIQMRIAKFNEYFSEISYKFYGERFILSSQRNDKALELVIKSLSGRLGTGKKKGQIFAFDLAYIQFADEINIKCLHFVLLDQIENVHDNQISSLLLEVINNINGQYILPVLTDKLPTDINIKEYEVLSLSQDEKLFKI
jgi:uncharacterized protein YydD (DUF2326 family)